MRTLFHKMDLIRNSKTCVQVTFLIILQILVVTSQLPDPGGTPDIITVYYNISEELQPNSPVGTLPVIQGYTYHIQDQQTLFQLNENSGQITTKVVIDRETLSQNTISFFVTGTSLSNTQQHPINVRIRVLDINDNFPTFPKHTVTINFLENIKGSQVSLSTASDPDSGNNGNVSNYEIVTRDDDNKFEVLYDTAQYGEVLIVRNLEKLNREERSSYELNVSVQDHGSPPKFGYLQILIRVDDANDNPPIFDQSQYKATINESAPIGSLVIHVAASDDDIGVNSQITYSLQDDSGQFDIDSRTGEVITKVTPLYCFQRCDRSVGELDCEPYSCILTITTTDGGSPPLSGRAYVSVKVVDENNHAPTISIRHYPDSSKPHSEISENQNTPSVVALVTVSDADPGTQISALSIVSGNEKGHFKMITTSDFKYSSVQLISMPDRERISSYNLTIVAVDSGNPPKSSAANLLVYVIDVNDHVPWFPKLEYRITLGETMSIGSFVESLTANDEDSGQNADLTYSILSGNELGWFKLDDKTGLMTVNARMHYEIASTVVMNISVHDGGPTPHKKNFTKVIISILDENDKAPAFADLTFNVTLDENKNAGHEILMATANDADSGSNGTVTYQLHSDVQLNYPNTFSINVNTGRLTTQKILDREETAFYEIKIVAKDQGPQPLSSTATVYLKIIDQNDEKPVFYPEKYFVNFEESQPIGTTVVGVTAFDKDSGLNAKITYSFVSNYPEFSLDQNSGIIKTAQTLQKSMKSRHELLVKATDPNPAHVSTNTAIVEVLVTNKNDIAPSFIGAPYEFSITEDSGTVSNPVAKTVGSVNAVASGKTVQYSIISGDINRVFTINSNSGTITAVKGIDREIEAVYELSVIANTDSKSTETKVKITVNDLNDHAPKFELDSQEIGVPENLPIGTQVYLASAVDHDAGPNSVVTYTLHDSSSSGLFRIDTTSGMIILERSLVKLTSNHRSYKLTINATDGGTPQLMSSQQIMLKITDVNDHTPVFSHSKYEISLIESTSVNDQFLTLQAIDADLGDNGRIMYNITRGNGDGSFGVFPDGTLYVAKPLDREERDHYQLTVHATDFGREHRNSLVNITINILDNNDNKPLFVNTTYTMHIKENSAIQTVIGSVSATDTDIGRNAEISYYLKTGNDKFSVDPQTGEIRSLAVFDREQLIEDTGNNYYTIEVTASDNGFVKLQDITTVKVFILDANDNPPIFSLIVYRPAINENIPKYSPVVKVTATDKDSGVNQALTYSIISGNEDELFIINSGNGQITLNGVLDRESLDNYVLKVLATDSGEKIQNSATCTVLVKILDVNDNSPLFAQSVYTVALSEFTVVGDEIIQFAATDTDLGINAQILYSITGGDGTFVIDANTGKLYLNRELDYETKHEYKLNVSASDKGTPSVMPTYASLTIKIKDENDNTPTFINTPNMASITENAKSFQSIMKVSAQDIDSGVNGQILFSIANQEPIDNMFTIDSEQGRISFTGFQLDREQVSSYTLTVVASDRNITNTRSAEKSILINVMDENDESPKFTSTNAIKLNYPVSLGPFATIAAEDLDEGNNGKVTYTLLTQNTYFILEPSTGTLSVRSDLPSSQGTFTLRVKASDNGMIPRSKEMDITVILVPASGNGPQFDSSSYSTQITENESIGQSLMRVYTNPYRNEKFYITGISSTGKSDQLFQIDENSGVISASMEVDREIHGSSIDVTVCAVQPSQSSPKASCTQVSITITDLNDTPPKFSRNLYTVDVSEAISIGSTITTVTVTDADTVGQLSLTIRTGADGKFSIDNSGQISLSSKLDRETQKKHTLVIEASDAIHPATGTVVVTVTDINDTPPQFTKSLYTFDVSEDTAVGTTLGRVEATDPDEGYSGEVYYSLISLWGSDLFNLDLQKGTFTLLGNLDFEEVQLYTLKVQAEDRGNPKLTSTVTVYMNIKDTNDNEPVFDPMSYNAEVKEDVSIGTSVAMVSATDIDSGLNGKISYEIFDGDVQGQFGIGRTNGTLFTQRSLDRESIANYTLTVLAIDQAEPPEVRRTTTTEVKVTVADVNDNSPVFITPSVMSVPENKQLNEVAFVVKVQDDDIGQNSAVTFSLSRHPDSPFRMNPATGEMLVNTVLDRETRPNFTVTITAFDKGNPPKSSTQSLTIKIGDVNDNAPVFNPVSYTKAIAENTEIGKTLLTVTATDQDEGLNGNVRYFIVAGDDNFDFAIDPSSGVIRVQKNLDYERVQIYKLKIQAEDSGSVTQSAFAEVTISILDINDEEPVFLDSPYYPLVLEEADNLPVQVLQVSARDQDSAPNNLVTYGFREGNVVDGEVVFKINSTSGEITCLKKLDREVRDRYELIVYASDSGFPSNSGTGSIVITVKDINDHSPEFEHSSIYIGHIAENLPGNSPILIVKATDKDTGANSQIIYSLEDSFDGKFSVHPTSGGLSAVKSLDREETAVYNLKLVARDSGLVPKQVTADVTVIVDDKNDNTPQFERDSYQQTVNNPTQQGDFVMGVTALDHDIGGNGQVVYTLTGSSKFAINSQTGILTASQTLSTARATYKFLIKAEDQGDLRKSSTVNVTVTVSDISSLNRPNFTSFPSSPLVLDENKDRGHSITTIQAMSNVGSSANYHIAGGNVGKSFAIDQSSGEVTVYHPVDFEMTQRFDLWIEARDTSNAALSAYRKLVINIQDLNDNTPRFSEPLYLPTIFENAHIGSTVVQIIASDGDSGNNGKLTYRLSSDEAIFRIDPSNGLITTVKALDRETVETYSLIVEAVDQGVQPLTGSTTVRILVSDINDNRPVFSQNFNIEIPEDLAVGSFVIQVTASDDDIGDNAKITYNIIGNPDGKFSIDPTSGNITLLGKLDAELYGSKGLQINITASDGAYVPHAYVIVYVTDVNDNAPQFKDPLKFSLIEGQKAGTVVGRVTATDRDISKPNNQTHYSFKLSSSEFNMDSSTGEITSKMEMVYIHNSELANVNTRELIVVATDHGTPPRSSEAIIHIEITDANDHAPIFEQRDYYSAVPDNVVIGDLVMTVLAKDEQDYGVNAEVQYFKESGSGVEYFFVNKLTGDITIAKALQGQINREFNLIVKAEDKGVPPKNVTQEIKFTITGINQHSPVFTTTDLQTTVPENTIIGSSIAKVNAYDDDQSGPNGKVSYHIIGGDPKGQFLIDTLRGDISVHRKLDFEINQQHHLKIMAKDQGLHSRNSTVVFIVHITDINDNAPVFNSTHFVASVYENTPSDHVISTITATDADSGQNAIVEYSFEYIQMSTMFTIDRTTGSIRTKAPLDYETTTSYDVIIRAVNPGTQLKNTTEVRIEVKGVNEFYPKFHKKDYPFSIKESIPIGTVLGSVTATDDDHGEDGVVYYYLVGLSNSKGFKLDYKTGEIIVSGRPDYESSPTIVLNVMAKNWGSIKGGDTDECTISITVEDANDAPVFSKPLYNATLDENSGSGVRIIQVVATDTDHNPSDQSFSFKILDGNAEQSFAIDSTSGWVSTTGFGVLDRETVPVYNITVAAVDKGIVPQTGTAMVQINLLDKNDNGPTFTFKNLTGYIMENLNGAVSILSLYDFTTDIDLPPNQGPYQYRLLGTSNYFQVNEVSGLVTSKTAIDREQTPKFDVGVIVSDGGTPTQSSTLTFGIVVRDENDNPSSPRAVKVQVALFDGRLPTSSVADVRPLDPDLVGNYSCEINSQQNIFTMTGNTCKLNLVSYPDISSSTIVSFSGSDGRHEKVSYNAEFSFLQFDNKTLDRTVILRVNDISPENFVATKQATMKQYLSGLFGQSYTVLIYSVKSFTTDALVFIAVQAQGGTFVLHDILKQQIVNKKTDIETEVGVKITAVGYSPCTSTTCRSGECLNHIDVHTSINVVDSDALIISSPDLWVSYRCSCPPQFTGTHCETPVSPCGEGHCQNGGFCVANQCDCPSGWSGTFCQTDVNECLNSPCQNGASCNNTLGSFQCVCREGFTGNLCQNGADHCSPNPCVQGTCQNLVGGYHCKCPFSSWGEQCQHSTVGFSTGSFIQFSSSLSSNDNTFDVTIATVKSRALILYNPAENVDSSEFLALEIINGNVRFSFNLGDLTTTRIVVPKNVSTGEWFRIQVHRSGEHAQLRVSTCPPNGGICPECQDSACVRSASQMSRKLNLGAQPVTIGGIENINEAIKRNGQIETHDFVGCMREFKVNNEDYLGIKKPLKELGVDRSGCPRQQGQSSCTSETCSHGGICVDEWSSYSCRCPKQYHGKTCQQEFKPFGFGPSGYVTFKQKETYQRDVLISQSRRRRTPDTSSIFIRFRTTSSSGLLFFADRGLMSSVLYVQNKALKYTIMNGNNEVTSEVKDSSISDGNWHNATVIVTGTTLVMVLDIQSMTFDNVQSAFPFFDVYISQMSLGGTKNPITVGSKQMSGFGGCISEFEMDEKPVPMNGTTDRFIIETSSGVENGCGGLCSSCTGSCTVNGEVAICKQAQEDELLGTGVIVVIGFFAFLLIVIVVVFLIYRFYWQRRGKSGKQNGHVNKSFGSGHSPEDSGYGDNDFIHHHVQTGLRASPYAVSNGHVPNRPDLINANGRTSALPLEMDDGTVIIDNGDIQINGNEDAPELYDLENASSIAPSDIDVSYYYGASRHGKGQSYRDNYKKHLLSSKNNGHGPPSQQWNSSRDSPGALRMQTTAMLNRNSPANVQNQQHLNRPNRNSPSQYGSRLSPMDQIHRQSPHSRASPLVQSSARGTPLSEVHHGRADSDHSIVSHHSHHSISSTSSASRLPPLPNGNINRGRKPHTSQKPVKGLTIEEVDKLNARPTRPSPVSMLEAVSSSSEGRRQQQQFKIRDHLDDGAMLEPLDSSSDESANDSFTCSEFEYENDKGRNDFDRNAMIYSKLAEVDNENEDFNMNHNMRNNDGLDSNGSSFASSDGGKRASGAPLNGAINWDYFTDWGPSFEKLVGVFKDIASLPDGDENANSNMDCRTETEEYV